MRVKLELSYDGSLFQGYQIQKHTPNTVAGKLQEALKNVQIESEPVASGRTDRGVHALRQIVHVDLPPFWQDVEKLKRHLNHSLRGITIRNIYPTYATFHARFDATQRTYLYLFKTTNVSVFEEAYVSKLEMFDTTKLQNALATLQGEHDFAYFHKQGSKPHTTKRKLFLARYKPYKNYHIIKFTGNAFLRSQVRMMVEACMHHAQNRLSLEQLIEQRDVKTQHTHTLAPAHGLYLSKIVY